MEVGNKGHKSYPDCAQDAPRWAYYQCMLYSFGIIWSLGPSGCQSRPSLTITDSLYCLDIGSIASKMGMPMSPLYAAVKAAMVMLSYAVSRQVRFGLFCLAHLSYC